MRLRSTPPALPRRQGLQLRPSQQRDVRRGASLDQIGEKGPRPVGRVGAEHLDGLPEPSSITGLFVMPFVTSKISLRSTSIWTI